LGKISCRIGNWILSISVLIYAGVERGVHNLYYSTNITRMIKSRRMRWAGHVTLMWEKRNAYIILVGKLEGKRPLGRSRRMWVDNIKIDLREIGTSGGLL
jgi:hypothetical protein